jgi:hypothetical protein
MASLAALWNIAARVDQTARSVTESQTVHHLWCKAGDGTTASNVPSPATVFPQFIVPAEPGRESALNCRDDAAKLDGSPQGCRR